jgi:hypothetical protein
MTLAISETREPPAGAAAFVRLNDHYYAVASQGGYQWNQKAFSLLYQLFQMSVSSAPPAGPGITIAK